MDRGPGAIAVLAALALLGPGCSVRESATSEVRQGADGCGAFRYKGIASLACRYRGALRSSSSLVVRGVCVGDSYIACTYGPRKCDWEVESRTTRCIDRPTCLDALPPTRLATDATVEKTLALSPGETLCDPPATPEELRDRCLTQSDAAMAELRQKCTDQTLLTTGDVSCCLDCAVPPPGGALAGSEVGGDTYACSAVDD